MKATIELKSNLNKFEEHSNNLDRGDLIIRLNKEIEFRKYYVHELCEFTWLIDRLINSIKRQGWQYTQADLRELLNRVDDDLDSVENSAEMLKNTHPSVPRTLDGVQKKLEDLYSFLSHIEMDLFDQKLDEFCPEIIPEQRRIQAENTLAS